MIENPVAEKRQKLTGLEAARGVAASMVAFQHAGIFTMTIDHAKRLPLRGITFGFHVGVDFFFVLSGFLITWLHWNDLGKPARLKHYLLRRFARIYPAFWCVAIPLVILHAASGRDTAQHIVTSLLLLPSGQEPILGVAWTLVFEVFFYAVFGVLILGGKNLVPLLPLWAAAIALHYAIAGVGGFPANFFCSTYNIEFLTGMGTALILRRMAVPFPAWVMGLGVLMFFGAACLRIGAVIGPASLEFRIIFAAAAGFIVLGAVELDRARRLHYPGWLVLLGAASYAIYLVHSLVEAGAAKWLQGTSLPPGILMLLIAASGIAGGILFHLAVERHVTRKVAALLFGPARHRLCLPDAGLEPMPLNKEV